MRRGNALSRGIGAVLVATLIFAGAAVFAAQQQKPQKGGTGTTGLRPPDDQQIETNIGEMLAGWQIGDAELMHKYYADDLVVVSGLYEPPLVGWANYAAAYRQQRQRMQSVRLDRRNTLVKIRGDVAWASYQWEFSATVDGRSMGAQGQATLVLERRGDRWLIVHNHTSVVSVSDGQAPQPPANNPGT